MAGTTTNFSFPYPEGTDPVDVAGDIQGLADSIDLVLNTELSSVVQTTDVGVISSTMLDSSLTNTISSKASLSGATFTGDVIIQGSLNSPYEPVIAGTISTNTLTHDINNGNVATVSSAPSENFTLNITNLSAADNRAVTVSVFVTQGSTGYIPSALQIAGSGQTIKWQGGTAPIPTSNAGKIDIFSFTITRVSSTWTVYGSMVGNF